jgi:L-threonylcarbamoyladenylate synthase
MSDIIQIAAQAILAGKVVAFPTETVYGLGADATNDEACRQIYTLKQRPSFNPLIVHVPDVETAKNLAEFNKDAEILSKLWPGPLTMVLPLKNGADISNTALARLSTIAIRIPAHPIARQILKETNVPIAAPSANLSGYVSASTKEHVEADFGDQILIVPDRKDINRYGLESTIVDLSTNTPTILRHGFITSDLIEEMLGKKIAYDKGIMQIKAPGMMERHYSPSTSIRLNAELLEPGEIGLNFGGSNLSKNNMYNLSDAGDLAEAAQNLYSMLRKLDKIAIELGIKTIAISPIPKEGIGVAINDRLTRASN